MRAILAFACVCLLTVPQGALAVDESLVPISFAVRLPDGSPAAGSEAVAYVADITTSGRVTTYQAVADALGRVTLSIPKSDPYVTTHPVQEVYNVRVHVTHRASAGRAVQPLAVPITFRSAVQPRPYYGIVGRTFELVALPPSAVTDPRRVLDATEQVEPSYCNETEVVAGGWAYFCTEVSYPLELSQVTTPLASNVGAGSDMITYYNVSNSQRAWTETVSGIEGVAVKVQGRSTLGTEDTTVATWRVDGVRRGQAAETAAVLEAWKKVDLWYCTSSTGCLLQSEDYLPHAMVGKKATMLPTTTPVWHDLASQPGAGNSDCTVGAGGSGGFTNTHGDTTEQAYEVGFDFVGGARNVELHAHHTVDQVHYQDIRNGYSWEVAQNPLYAYHHLFVHNGLLGFDPSKPFGGPGTCPINSPGLTFTDASDVNKENPPSPTDVDPPVEPPVDPPVDDSRVDEHVDRCKAAPERCGQEG